jgi:ATP-dependent Clp endopeptidase proteolytic subunit ClpP
VKNTGRGYSIQAKADKEAEIWIYEEIGESWFGGLSAKQFSKDVKALGEVTKITLRLNSPGGDVFDGMAIYNILKQHKARVEVSIDGQAASIASVIAMAGDEINMAANAMMMIHEAWTVAVGPAKELRAAADMIEKVNHTILITYASRASVDQKQINELMEKETWMTGDEALGYGLVDNLTGPIEMAAHFDMSKFKYKNMPDFLNKKAGGSLEHPPALRQKLAAMQIASQKIRTAGTSGKQ